ncbi:DUF2235 domain-containing protein [Parasphingorhabdus cellanae]|uniref:DUF2235 domain-containing protein n=1 Tax=Parasphingorhabdus cellanae TaxID=2806553 RepID=A0ABX7T0Z7_9SPHN|nr:DUF2235 domain-containing protein [Parasphingorhabdus cellanae]QTD55224.1 DUF2235 domain-containing protein [Parasphingorhabdus cellanae]
MKRLIVCCDGTWEGLDNDWPTNVQRIAQFLLPSDQNGIAQTLYYDPGIGMKNAVDRIAGGAFGAGLDLQILEAYSFLSMNFEAGDEIYLFGFSRGAYSVRSLAGLIRCCGIVKRRKIRTISRAMELYRDREIKPDHDECVTFRNSNSILEDNAPPQICFLGCWDTVGALGIPDAIPMLPVDNRFDRKYEFHDTQLGSHIKNARHAVAIDEHRRVFDVTSMQQPDSSHDQKVLKERWFPGNHGGVGGGVRDLRQCSDGPLLWMMEEAKHFDLAFNESDVGKYTESDPLIDLPAKERRLFGLLGKSFDRHGPVRTMDVSPEAHHRWNEIESYNPKTLHRVYPPKGQKQQSTASAH